MEKKEGLRINAQSQQWNREHKPECSFFNWVARMDRFLRKCKDIYPEPSKKEIEAFRSIREWRKRNGNPTTE